MILYYAAGGGLGHLTRGRALLHTLGRESHAAFMTASRFAADPRVTGGAEIVAIPPELAGDAAAYGRWLMAAIERLAPEAIYIDTFPAGILGELTRISLPANIPRYHVARLLRWDRYRGILSGALPSFEATYVAEPLDEEQERAIRDISGAIVPIVLRDPPYAADLPSLPHDPRPLWLVVHSEPAGEIMELIAYARELAAEERIDPRIILASPSLPEDLPPSVEHLEIYPAAALFPIAERIITGCGFNAMRQTLPFHRKHRFIPFPRRYDDQFLRAARRRAMS